MSEMVERVARAMCIAGGFDPSEIMANDGPRWKYYVPGARAAIAAMREPTNDMGYAGEGVGDVYVEDIYRAMIDAALAGNKVPA